MGITRESIIKICKDLGYSVEITDLTTKMLLTADEAFFTGSATEITPISTVDRAPIGSGKPGSITIELKNLYMDIIQGKEANYHNWLTFINKYKNASETVLEDH